MYSPGGHHAETLLRSQSKQVAMYIREAVTSLFTALNALTVTDIIQGNVGA